MIYICNFHVLNHFLLIYICKLHWNLSDLRGLGQSTKSSLLGMLNIDTPLPTTGTGSFGFDSNGLRPFPLGSSMQSFVSSVIDNPNLDRSVLDLES